MGHSVTLQVNRGVSDPQSQQEYQGTADHDAAAAATQLRFDQHFAVPLFQRCSNTQDLVRLIHQKGVFEVSS